MGLCVADQQGGIFVQLHVSTSLRLILWDATDPGSAGYLSFTRPLRKDGNHPGCGSSICICVCRDTGEDSISPLIRSHTNRNDQREAEVQVNEGFLWTRSHTRDTAVSSTFVLREQHTCAQTGSPQRAQIGKPLMLIHGRQWSVPLLMKPREWCCRGTQVEKQPEKDAIYSPASTFSSYWSSR